MSETRYARSGDDHVAFQVMGDGPVDLVYVPGWVSHLELELENGLSRRFYEALASFTRLIRFDKRGTGMSDRATESMALEQRMDDIRAVMDAAEVDRASLLGYLRRRNDGGHLRCHLPRPRRQVGVVRQPRRVRSPGSPDFPCGYEAEPRFGGSSDVSKHIGAQGIPWNTWPRRCGGIGKLIGRAPGHGSFERMAATPGRSTRPLPRFNLGNDARSVMPLVKAETLVLHRAGDRFVPLCNGEHLAGEIPHAHLVIVDGDDHLPYVGDAAAVVREVERFLVGTTHHAEALEHHSAAAGDPLTLLTAAELRVAECVAQGMPNPAIAVALQLSRHTVESHLKRIYTKLGVTRVQLAGIVSGGATR